MSAHDHLPAHLVPCDPDTLYQQRPARGLTIGTPPSPETRVCEYAGYTGCRLYGGPIGGSMAAAAPPPIVTIRQAGEHASELYVRTGDGAHLVVVPLSYGLLINLLEDATAALRRCEETK